MRFLSFGFVSDFIRKLIWIRNFLREFHFILSFGSVSDLLWSFIWIKNFLGNSIFLMILIELNFFYRLTKLALILIFSYYIIIYISHRQNDALYNQ